MKRLVLVGLLGACSQNDAPPPQLVSPPASVETARRDDAPRDNGVRQKLFADDVTTETLPLSISIETLGNVATPIIPRGTRLPTSHTELFSTAQDDQDRVEVHVLQGERPLATQNRSLGKFQLFGIPPAPRGLPQIEVTFLIDTRGVLTVSARDRGTGRANQVRIDGAAGAALDQAAVDKLLADAQTALKDDVVARDWAQAKLALEQLIYTSRSLLSASGAKLSTKTRALVEQELTAAEAMLKLSTTPSDPALLRAVEGSLRRVMHTASKEIYKP